MAGGADVDQEEAVEETQLGDTANNAFESQEKAATDAAVEEKDDAFTCDFDAFEAGKDPTLAEVEDEGMTPSTSTDAIVDGFDDLPNRWKTKEEVAEEQGDEGEIKSEALLQGEERSLLIRSTHHLRPNAMQPSRIRHRLLPQMTVAMICRLRRTSRSSASFLTDRNKEMRSMRNGCRRMFVFSTKKREPERFLQENQQKENQPTDKRRLFV
jgi:hypothetical protein